MFALLGLVVLATPRPASPQPLPDLVSACNAEGAAWVDLCLHAGLAARAAHSAFGLAASGGADVPGSASTLGWRMKGSPRIGFSLKGTATRAPFPSFRADGGTPGGKTQKTLPSVHASVTVGLFDGFSPGPTMGGVGSVDVLLSGQWIGTPESLGFRGRELGWGIGARIGILRESFSLPGISLSVSRRSLGDVKINAARESALFRVHSDFSQVSIRGIVGKDIAGIGLFAGAGWDRSSGTTDLRILAGPGPGGQGEGNGMVFSGQSLEMDRRLLFAGGSMTFLALQVSVEAGLAEGLDADLPDLGSSDFDPSQRSQFLALGFRLTF